MFRFIGRTAPAAILLAFVPGASAAQAPAAAELAAAQSAAAQSAAAQPARWHLDGATERCVLTRRLEGTPIAANFILRTIPGSGRYDVILAAPDLSGDVRRIGRPSVLSLAPGGAGHAREGTSVDLPGRLGSGVAFGSLGSDFAAQFSRAASLDLADDQGRPLGRWTIPVAARAAEALAACEAEKLTDWGADPAAVEPGATAARPLGDPASWLTIRDLGMAMSTQSGVATVVFRLVVGPDGRAAGCTMVEQAGNIDLTGACRALSGSARFEPARDARGNPVRSVFVHVASFRLDVIYR
jgi:hypothetical protein